MVNFLWPAGPGSATTSAFTERAMISTLLKWFGPPKVNARRDPAGFVVKVGVFYSGGLLALVLIWSVVVANAGADYG